MHSPSRTSSLLFKSPAEEASDLRSSNDAVYLTSHHSLHHLCRYDDETFVFNFSEGRFPGCRRAEWLFYWARSAYSTENIISSWRSLLESDDIWLQWIDGDEELLRVLPSPSCTIKSYGWRIASDTLDRRLKSQDCDRASQLRTNYPRQSVNAPIEMRMAAIAWLARTFTERVMGAKTISALVLEWWYTLPYWLQNKLPASTDAGAWHKFSSTMAREGHTCHLERENQDKWKAWVTVQALLFPDRRLEAMNMISQGTRCQRCTQGPSRQCSVTCTVPNHILLLQYVRHVVKTFLQNTAHDSSDEHWIRQFSSRKFKWKMSFTTAALKQVDDWVQTRLLTRKDDLKVPLDWIELVSASSSGLGNQQDMLEIENELALMSQDDSSSCQHLDIRAWICAIVLSSMTVTLGTERSAAQAFAQFIQLADFKFLLDCAPIPTPTPVMSSFREAVHKSGHTCWSAYSADLYSSAYSLLWGQDNLSAVVVGCRSKRIPTSHSLRRLDWHFTERECVSCRDADILRDLGEAIDRGPLKSAGSPEDLIEQLNDIRDRNGLAETVSSEDIVGCIHRLIGLGSSFKAPSSSFPDPPKYSTDDPNANECDYQSDSEMSDVSEKTCKQFDRDSERTVSPPPWRSSLSSHSSKAGATSNISTDDHAYAIARESTYGATLQVFRYSSERESLKSECFPASSSTTSTSSSKPRSISKTDMIEAIKKHLLRLLEDHSVPIETARGVPKLPWRTLPHILRENGLAFDNWPVGVPEPRDGNGINKVPLHEIAAIYEAVLRKDYDKGKALGIRTVRPSVKERERDRNRDASRKPSSVNVVPLLEDTDMKPLVRVQDGVVRKRSVSCCEMDLEEISNGGSVDGKGKLKRKRMEDLDLQCII